MKYCWNSSYYFIIFTLNSWNIVGHYWNLVEIVCNFLIIFTSYSLMALHICWNIVEISYIISSFGFYYIRDMLFNMFEILSSVFIMLLDVKWVCIIYLHWIHVMLFNTWIQATCYSLCLDFNLFLMLGIGCQISSRYLCYMHILIVVAFLASNG